MSVQSWKIESGVFHWEGKNVRPSSRLISVVEPEPGYSSDGGRGNLYVLAESPERDGEAEKAISRVIQAKFYNSGLGDLEAALGEAVRAANEAARRRNAHLHVSMLLLRGSHAYLTQVGEALIGTCVGGTLSWYSPLVEGVFLPLGNPDAQPVISHLHLQEGDAVYLFSRAWLNVIDSIGADKVEPVLCDSGSAADVTNNMSALLSPDLPPLEMGVVSLGAPVMEEQPAEEILHEEEQEKTPARPAVPVPKVKPPSIPRPKKIPVLWIAILLPLLVVALSAGFWWKHQKAQEEHYTALVTNVQSLLDQATQQGVQEDVARQKLQQAWDESQEALQLRPNDEKTLQLQDKIRKAQDKINKVTLLYMPWKLRSFSGGTHQLSRVIAAGQEIYVLDKGEGALYRDRLNDAGDALVGDQPSKPVLKKGDVVGAAVVGDPIDMAWMLATANWQESGLMLLDSGHDLFRLGAGWGGIRQVDLKNTDGWKMPQIIGSYMERLYVLDNQSNQIWRYVPAGTAYPNAPEGYFPAGTPMDLAGVVDMSIDGSIYLLYSNGSILKFFAGKVTDFNLTGLDMPLRSPTAMFTDDHTMSIYIADAGNDRIVQIDKEGHFQRQFRLAENPQILGKVRSLYVNESGGEFYYVTDNALYKANFPRE